MEREVINNAFYNDLGEGWYDDKDHPIALLRAENEARIPWVLETIEREKQKRCQALDIGCGAGFLSNRLAIAGHEVTGIDLSTPSLKIAARKDVTGKVKYIEADGLHLPFADNSFDVVAAMDFLEHIDEPKRALAEVGRVLRPGGLFFFHTFNRTMTSWLFADKGVRYFVKNSPKNLHLHRLFIKPIELRKYLKEEEIVMEEIHGLSVVYDKAFLKMLFTRHVDGVSFRLTKSLSCGYVGYGKKK